MSKRAQLGLLVLGVGLTGGVFTAAQVWPDEPGEGRTIFWIVVAVGAAMCIVGAFLLREGRQAGGGEPTRTATRAMSPQLRDLQAAKDALSASAEERAREHTDSPEAAEARAPASEGGEAKPPSEAGDNDKRERCQELITRGYRLKRLLASPILATTVPHTPHLREWVYESRELIITTLSRLPARFPTEALVTQMLAGNTNVIQQLVDAHLDALRQVLNKVS